jgi:hypothetical protein
LISFENQEGKDKIRNRLNYLKRIQTSNFQSFIDLCFAHDVDPSSLELRRTDFDSASFSDDSDSSTEVSDDDNDEIFYKQSLNKAPSKQTSKMEENNDVGELIVIKLPNGLYFVKAWVDSKLDSGILEIVVHDSGRKVMKRSKKPTAKKSASNMLLEMGYSWAGDRNHLVVASLEAELKKIQRYREIKKDDWQETTLCSLDEEVVKGFVDVNGRLINQVDHGLDEDGRQRISFFLITVRVNNMPAPAVFRRGNGLASVGGEQQRHGR